MRLRSRHKFDRIRAERAIIICFWAMFAKIEICNRVECVPNASVTADKRADLLMVSMKAISSR
jgi:hypothetical protein